MAMPHAKASVWIASRSSPESFEVAWRSTASFEIGARHAVAVVGDADQPAAAAIGQDIDAGRAKRRARFRPVP